MNRTADLCVDIRHDEPCGRLALDGLRLCHGHRRELERLIAEMPARYDDLDRALGAPAGSRGTGAPGLHVDEPAAMLRSEMAGILASWAAVVVDERGVTPPAGPEIWRTAPWLLVHLDWLAAHAFVVDMLAELRGVTGRSYGITDIPARFIDLGEQCLTHDGGERCEGVVTIVVRGDDWVARCPACGIDQDPTPYLRAVRAGQWITTDGVIRLAGLFGIAASEDVVRQWKHRRRITGRLTPDGNLYDLLSVQRYLVRRQSEARKISA